MTQDELDRAVRRLMERYDEVNSYYIDKVASQIAAIGELGAASINVIAVMASMYEDIADINARIAKAAQITAPQLNAIYNTALNDVYRDDRFVRAMQETPLPQSSKRALERYAQAVSRQTADALNNLSNTTVVSQTYRQAVDKAVLAVSSGMGDYQSMIRKTVREIGYSGLQLEYESGYHRRLDSAVRQNIVDGAKQIQQHASDIIGEELGYDAKEISVHANSAPDHEPVQGHVFLNDQFELLQSNQASRDVDGRFFPAMERPIGEWNCMHFAFSFSTKYSRRKYTNQQLDDFARKNAEGCEIDGKHYTMYEARQLQRQIETEVRRQKDVQAAAQAAGDNQLASEARQKIRALSRKYDQVSEISGLDQHRDRMRIVKPA